MNGMVLTAGTAFAIALALGPATIGYLRRLRLGQQVRSDGPRRHHGKAGTPTMGGVLIVFAAAAATVAFAPGWKQIPYGLAVIVGYGLIGLADDALKVIWKRSLGLRAREKLLFQLLFAGFLAAYGLADPQVGPFLRVPFLADPLFLSPWAYGVLTVATVVGAANAVNLTDGLDGLAAGATAIAAFTMAALAWLLGNGEMAILAAAVGGACLGFSWYNAHPAQVFMGDTGSLALGAALAVVATMTGTQLFLVLVGGLFVAETVSVALQVVFFRLTGGRRIFRMSPLHHHFELGGWAEPQVVTRFWLIGIVCGALGLLALQASL